ncbi:hypothetical protein BGZ61DRAFT_492057 [Ilyonectria robusta]|uniref:uncharacterized protein n=1 Tax=Ilyonectria robusta TaxID=1079257 RepID=UPI001E8E31E6|nr:uncharacterized protein BGZ61DRAFT_492057 [Ilyonectria robusta]KAH8729887.1 hypothetical protein BGZ61DRAFT_492057 [Ilyonectria robusta]
MALPGPGAAAVLVSQWILITIAAVVVLARVYLRLKIQKRKILSSDLLMCAAWVSAVATASFDIKFATMGALEPKVKTTLAGYDGTPEDIVLLLKLFWASSIPFFTTFYLCKAALLAVYLQVFPKFMKKRRIFLWGTIGFVAAAYIVSMLLVFCICLPIETNWSLDPETTCPNASVALVFQVGWALHFSGDILIFALPWLIVPGLQMKWKLKMGVYCTFLLGTINIIFCLVRFITIQTSTVDNVIPLSLVELWSALDCNIGLVIACLPSLRPYFRGRTGSDYPYNSSNVYSKSTNTRPGDGFKVINEPYGGQASSSGTPRRSPHISASNSNGFDEDLWEDGKKSNASDIELVHVKPVQT